MKLSKRVLLVVALAIVTGLVLSACGPQGNPLPEPPRPEDVGSGASSVAADTPEGTWESYVRDAIAEQVSAQIARINMLERYEDPAITRQNLAGTVTDIDLVEDRTEFNTNGNTASAQAEFDVKLTFANGDSDTRTCRFAVGMNFSEEDGVWYMANPQALAVFSVCSR